VSNTPEVDRAALIERISLTWARNAVAHALVLAAQDPSWGTDVFELAGGQVVLCGPGLYVNRALGLGLTGPLTAADLDVLEARSAAVGVPPSIDVVPTADGSIAELTTARGYGIVRFLTTHCRPLDDTAAPRVPPVDPSFSIERADEASLDTWQDVAAAGFGVGESNARRASDAFAKAAAVVDGAGFLLARDAADGRPLGCATVTVRDGLATFGAMTTLPSERGRGVQAALIAQRLRLARDAGCDLAASSTVPANASERNLARAGFHPLYETVTVARARPARGSS
jgi:GNAT superfamily N-acetyltransferase